MAENENVINLPTREQLEELNEKLDKILSGEAPAAVQVVGSIPEYGWLSTGTAPTPIDPTKFAMGAEIDSTTGETTIKYWDGAEWKELE